MLIAPLAALLYHSSDFVPLTLICSIGIPLTAMTTVPTVLLRTKLNFRFVAVYNVAEFVAVQILTVVLAFKGFGPYSFVIPTPILAFVRLVVFCAVAPFSLKRRFRFTQVAYLIRSGSAVFTSKFLIQLISQGDYFVLGVTSTKAEVGLYYFSFKLATQTVWIVAGNISNVVAPMLVKFSGRVREQVAVTWSVCRLMAFVAIPVCFLQALESQSVIRIFFGGKWFGAFPIVAILSIGLGLDAVTWITAAFMNARKEYGRGLAYTAAFAPLFFALVYAGARLDGAIGVAVGVGVYYALYGPIMSGLVLSRYEVKWAAVLGLFVRPTLLAVAACAIAAADRLAPWPAVLLPVQVVLECVVWAGAYIALLALFNREVLLDVAGRFLPDRHATRVRKVLAPQLR